MLKMLALLFPVAAFAAPEVTASRTDPLVEVSWAKVRFAVALPVDHTCSKSEAERPGETVNLSVCRNGGDATAPQLEITLERSQRDAGKLRLDTTVRLARGASTSIGRFAEADRTDEVVAWLR